MTEWGRFQLLCDLQYLESVADSLGEFVRVGYSAEQTLKPENVMERHFILGVDITDDWKNLLILLNAEMSELAEKASELPRALSDQVCRMRKIAF